MGRLFQVAAMFVMLGCFGSVGVAWDTPVNPSVYQPFTKVTLTFQGPPTSEQAEVNPFTDYRLFVRFIHADVEYFVRGFYAADGHAAETGASSGNVWAVRFAPDRPGKWRYEASLRQGPDITLQREPQAGQVVPLDNAAGSFSVTSTSPKERDPRTRGRLVADGRFLRFGKDGPYWLKGGADSPENLLAFADFDGTYRLSTESSDGEAQASAELHRYAPHLQDWRDGDPTWQAGKGKALIGAINYLASTSMNSVYFLTLNIGGDGKDVWPYLGPKDFERFDCSKLDQWEIVFEHMQRHGILLHVVTQETENETLLDGGNTGRLRQLYYLELISRFAHHPTLIWNLGEENGPADWTPEGQTTEQQRAMATFFKQHDPYQHPVVIHTHADAAAKDALLTGLLGHPDLDGVSFQVNHREQVHEQIVKWHRLSTQAGRTWLIGMDEIGMWHTGVKPDQDDPQHDTIRRYALWGGLMAGAAGVEWYFGAKYPANDLTCEDWRTRARIWELTRHALDFFAQIPYWAMVPMDSLVDRPGAYCLAQADQAYAIYLPVTEDAEPPSPVMLDLQHAGGQYRVQWFDPLRGGALQDGAVTEIAGGRRVSLGSPPQRPRQDWVVLVTKKS